VKSSSTREVKIRRFGRKRGMELPTAISTRTNSIRRFPLFAYYRYVAAKEGRFGSPRPLPVETNEYQSLILLMSSNVHNGSLLRRIFKTKKVYRTRWNLFDTVAFSDACKKGREQSRMNW